MTFKMSTPQVDCFLKWIYRKMNFPVNDALNIHSFLGYQSCLYYQGIRIHSNEKEVCIDLSGKGCRMVEELNKNWDWYEFISCFDALLTIPMNGSKIYQVNISRMDIACDRLNDEKLTFEFLLKYVLAEKWICKSQYYTTMLGNRINEFIFGSPESNRLLRIYNKAMEQKIFDGSKWMRYEFQLRNDSAMAFYLNLKNCKGNFTKVYYGMMHDYLRFITVKNDNMNSNRKQTCRWWMDFLHDVERIKQLYLPGNEYTIGNVTHFYNKGCASTVRTLLEASDGDISSMIETAENTPLNKRQKEALQKYKKTKLSDSEKAESNTKNIIDAINKPWNYQSRKDKAMQSIYKTLEEYGEDALTPEQVRMLEIYNEQQENRVTHWFGGEQPEIVQMEMDDKNDG